MKGTTDIACDFTMRNARSSSDCSNLNLTGADSPLNIEVMGLSTCSCGSWGGMRGRKEIKIRKNRRKNKRKNKRKNRRKSRVKKMREICVE